ncbi:MAG: GTP-binding protein [Elusimicrobia bacterium]|nr:GTP-binding protein [Elusimicrobiota bacterium]
MNVVLVGKPGVGKTTLFARLTGRKIYPRPSGVDRVTSDHQTSFFRWKGKRISVTDTPGQRLGRDIWEMSGILAHADVVVAVCDVNDFDSSDVEIISAVRKFGKPVIVAVNKVEGMKKRRHIADFYATGAEIFEISVLMNRGLNEFLDRIASFGDGKTASSSPKCDISVAVVGAPNVGKSTLLNALLGKKRFRTSPSAGTTNEVVGEILKTERGVMQIFDTAGIFRRIKKEEIRVYNFRMIKNFIRIVDVVCFVCDASDISQKDFRLASNIVGKNCVLVFNKTDILSKEEIFELKKRAAGIFPFLPDPPVFFISALKKKRVKEVVSGIFSVFEKSKAELKGLRKILKNPPPVFSAVKFREIRQTGFSPPVILLKYKSGKPMVPSKKRFMEKLIRKNFALRGVALKIIWKKI